MKRFPDSFEAVASDDSDHRPQPRPREINKMGLAVRDSYGDYQMPPPQPMTATQAIKAIRELGLTARFTYGEFRVSYTVESIRLAHPSWAYGQCVQRSEEVACYTSDAEDAVGTANQMLSYHSAL